MNIRKQMLMLFEKNKIDSRHFNLQALELEVETLQRNIEKVKASDEVTAYEHIFSHIQKRVGARQ